MASSLHAIRRTFAGDRVKEVDTTKSTSHNGVDRVTSSLNLHLSVTADVREHILLTHVDQHQFAVVAVGEEIYGSTLASLLTSSRPSVEDR